MHWIDIAILAVLGLSLLYGLWRGLINELFAIAAWILAFLTARFLSADVAQWLSQSLDSKPAIMLLAWVIPFVVAFLVVNLVRLLLKSMIDMIGLKPVDRFFGGVFGLLKGGLIITAIVSATQLVTDSGKAIDASESRFLPHFQKFSNWVLDNFDSRIATNLDSLMPSRETTVQITEALASSAALNLNLDREQVMKFADHLNISPEELAAQINNPEQLASLQKLMQNPHIQELLNKR